MASDGWRFCLRSLCCYPQLLLQNLLTVPNFGSPFLSTKIMSILELPLFLIVPLYFSSTVLVMSLAVF